MTRIFFKQSKAMQKGFTMIELLIIVAILGVLATVVLLNITKFIDTGDLAAAQAEAANVSTTLGAYFADNHSMTALDEDALSTAVTPYLNHTIIKGTYISNENGIITGVSYPPFHWSNGTWNK